MIAVSGPIAMFGWLSRMSRRSVVPQPAAPTTKIGLGMRPSAAADRLDSPSALGVVGCSLNAGSSRADGRECGPASLVRAVWYAPAGGDRRPTRRSPRRGPPGALRSAATRFRMPTSDLSQWLTQYDRRTRPKGSGKSGYPGARLDLWASFVKTADVRRVAEIGVYGGKLSERLLNDCPGIESYYMVDPWRHLDEWNKPANRDDTAFEEIYAKAMSRTEAHAAKRVVLRGTVREVIDDLPDEGLDFAYLDGDHTLRGITIDLVSVFPKVRPGGWIGGDDFRPSIWQHGAATSRRSCSPTPSTSPRPSACASTRSRTDSFAREEHHGLRVRRSHGPLRATRSAQPAREGRVAVAARRQAGRQARRVAEAAPRGT